MDPWREFSTPCSRGLPGHPLDDACLAPLHRQPPPPALPLSVVTLPSLASQQRTSKSFSDRPGRGLDLRTTTNEALLQILCFLATIEPPPARPTVYGSIRTTPLLSAPHLSHALVYTFGYRNSAWVPPLTPCVPTRQHPTTSSAASYATPWTPKPRTRSSKIYNSRMSTPPTPSLPHARRGAPDPSSSPTSARQPSPVPSSSTAGSTAATSSARKPRPALTAGLPATARTSAPSPSLTAAARLTRQSSPRPASPAASFARAPTSRARDRNGPSLPPATSKPQPPPLAPPTGPIHKTFRPSRRRSASRSAWSACRHRCVSFPPLPRPC
ncbi:hypothetical protein HPB49_023312 [Dermacentor silvarum]|uniref:Uncharacterized protein n=1 Tax=Dermacentor silvarum TaxID=543639 RepID=A0ACB8DR62_DERSI|nr:hypothetical protein HPB49_023312 [Dermacentor silvarum]